MRSSFPHCHRLLSADVAKPKARLTDEERAQSKKEAAKRDYEKHKAARREAHVAYCRSYYAANKDDLNLRRQEKRRLAKLPTMPLVAAKSDPPDC